MLQDEIASCETAARAAFTAYQSRFGGAEGERLFEEARGALKRAITLADTARDEPTRRHLVATLAYFVTSRRSLQRIREQAALAETLHKEAAALAGLRDRLAQRLGATAQCA